MGISAAAGSYSFSSGAFLETEFSLWMSRAELQVLHGKVPPDQYLARVEGRHHLGRAEYRAAVRAFPGNEFEQWAVFWGINEEELFQCEMQLLEEGFTRAEMQSFKDASDKILNQIVWLLPLSRGSSSPIVSPPAATPAAAVVQPEDEVLLTGDPAQGDLLQEEVDVAPKEARSERLAQDDDRLLTDQSPAHQAIHLVRPGDTLGAIARRYKVSVADLKKANGLRTDLIRVGQKLPIPEKSE